MLTRPQIQNGADSARTPSDADLPFAPFQTQPTFHGLMAVMTSSVDKVPLDLKATSYPSTDAMALDNETNGVHDVLFDEPEAPTADETAPPATEELSHPTTNGNHTKSESDAPNAADSIKNDSSGLDAAAPFLPDSQPDAKTLSSEVDLGATSVTSAVEAPTSDVRDEAGPTSTTQSSDIPAPTTQTSSESTQQVPETQLPDSVDAMETSEDAPTAGQDVPASSIESAPTKPMTELSLQTQNAAQGAADQDMEDAPTSGKVRSREEDDEEGAPDAKRTKTESTGPEFKVPEVPVHSEQTNGTGPTPAATPASAAPVAPQAGIVDVQTAVASDKWPTDAMTTAQNNFLRERLRNTKKIKVAGAFKEPVNAELLNIPNYPLIVTNPMDLGTMETKLKEDRYSSVRNFMEDLDLIVHNTLAFNGKEHPVTQAGYNMRAYFLKGMGKMPKVGVAEPVKPPKPKKPAAPPANKPRRESRGHSAQSPTAPAPTTAASPSAWPLKPDGTPIVRRDSTTTDGRPKREVRQPPSKDLPYNSAKPKKKKYQQELKFCESVMSELVKPKYWKFAHPFLAPVDPVALNIPSYLKIIKKPMDFGTIEKNLKDGQYQSAKDFYADAQLVFQNCFKFNPEGDEVNKMGKQMQDLFERLWKEKSDWLAQHAPEAHSGGTVYSDEEEEEEEEEEELDPAQAQILAIQEQIAKLNETAQSLLQQQQHKRPSPKASSKKKPGKVATKKKGPLAVPPPPKTAKAKPRVKAPAPLSFAQKQEISEGITTLGDVEMRKAVQIIRNGCPHLAHVNDEEMELDMDEIGDDTLRELFKFIKQVKGPKHAAVDEEYEPQRVQKPATASRPKKNKPMGKQEQEDSIKKIQDQLRHFTEASGSGSEQSPAPQQDEESSDDETSGSESEEE